MSGVDWFIRESGPDDQADLVALMFELQSYEARLHRSEKITLDAAKARLRKLQTRVQQQGGEVWVGETPRGEIAGFLIGLLCQEDPANPHGPRRDIGMISDLCVAEAYRGQGLAKRLMIEAELFFESQECQAISVANLRANAPAAQLYQALGYDVVFQWREKPL